MNNVREITGKITLEDGTVSEFSITAGLGWQQWGATRPRLGESVDAVEAMIVGLDNDGCMMMLEGAES